MADGYLNFDTKINEKGFNEGVGKLSKLGKSGLKVATTAITALGTAAGAGITAAVKVGAAFEAEMSKVSAISGATGKDLESLTDKAKEMGAKTKFSATESAQAMEYMAMAGWKTSDMLNGIEGIMNLAAASGEDLATTLEKNEYLILNTLEETITKYLSNGMTANLFNARGYDYSVFEQIPPGLISVNWSGEFGVDLYIFLKRKEAAW